MKSVSLFQHGLQNTIAHLGIGAFNSSRLQQRSNLSNKLHGESLTELRYTLLPFIPSNNTAKKATRINLEGN